GPWSLDLTEFFELLVQIEKSLIRARAFCGTTNLSHVVTSYPELASRRPDGTPVGVLTATTAYVATLTEVRLFSGHCVPVRCTSIYTTSPATLVTPFSAPPPLAGPPRPSSSPPPPPKGGAASKTPPQNPQRGTFPQSHRGSWTEVTLKANDYINTEFKKVNP